MKKTARKLLSVALALTTLVCAVFAFPMNVGAADEMQAGHPTITVYSTEVVFAGQEWYVIGYNDGTTAPSGVYTTNSNSATLLLKSTGTPYGTTAFRTWQSTSFANFTQYPVNTGYYYANNPGETPGWTTPNEYRGSTLQQAMEALAADTSKFSANEAAYINARTLTSIDGIAGEDVDNQLLWPLSESESNAIGNDTGTTVLSFGDRWWLRSPYTYIAYEARYVYGSGNSPAGGYHVGSDYAIRPAFNLDLTSVLFTSAATGGKPATEGADLTQVAQLTSTDTLKFTMLDDNLTLTNVTATSVSGNAITFSYTAASSGSSTYNALSAIVTDNAGNLKYYGQLTHAPAAGSGSATVEVPPGLDPTDKLLVFIEQANGDLHTDFASQPVSIARAAPTSLFATSPSTYGGADGQINGTTTEMEYSTDRTNWTPCTANSTIVPVGSYWVRYKAQAVNGIQAILTGTETFLTVDEGVFAPTMGNNITAPDAVDVGQALSLIAPSVDWYGVGGSEGWEISADGSTWTAFDPVTRMPIAYNGQYLRYFATSSGGTGYSNIVQITVNTPPVPVPDPQPPAPAQASASPQTGDNSIMRVWATLCVLSVAMLAAVAWLLTKQRRRNEG